MEIKSVTEAFEYLYNLSLNNSDFRFRGQANYEWTLIPSIYRFNNFQRYQTVQFEKNILQAKPPKPNPPLTYTNFELEWLMICQHYGVPTRLIDWTADILIALFFACSNEQINDGALFVCNQNDYPLFASYEDQIMETQKLAFVSTTVNNPRMRAQSGSFMIWGHSPLSDEKTESYDLWEYHKEENKSHFLEKILIPSKFKKAIMKQLDEFYSINYSNLYLENGYLEKTYFSDFQKLKENSRLATLYVTDADKLTEKEEKIARSMFKFDCRNMFGGCIRLSKIG
ncbi:FRG domain-containing protein [Gillisia sp. Hel_I_29]|uniref:FRG domain-containing protein n=1 Tax=Gillisia sp. Hel_I_29 TaxID=1249975 RepID=UPI00054E30B8|nr:FRG domain-containing protein [Gillisia sp. Hel_I_29]